MLLAEGAYFVAPRQRRDDSFFGHRHGSGNDRKAGSILHGISMSESNGKAGVESIAGTGRVNCLH